MRLNEISDEQKTFLTLQGIKFDFLSEYNNITSALSIIGKSNHRRILLGNDIEYLISDVIFFLNYGFSETDTDVIEAKNIYSKLLEIKDRL